MRKAKLIVLLALVCICVLSIAAYAQLPSANWPKFGRDYHNSGHNPNVTAVAKPVPSWQVNYYADSAKWNQNGYVTHDGVKIDPNGNIILNGDYEFGHATYDANGNFLSFLPMGTFGTTDAGAWLAGVTLYGTNSSFSQLMYMGSPMNTMSKIQNFSWDGTTFTSNWISSPVLWGGSTPEGLSLTNTYPGWTTGHTPFSCDASIAVAPNGTVYWGNTRCSGVDPQGPIAAYDGSTGAMTWHYSDYINTDYAFGSWYRGPGYLRGTGRMYGSYAIGYGGDAPIVYATGTTNMENSLQNAGANVSAVKDTPDGSGNAYTYLWRHSGNEGGLFPGGDSSLGAYYKQLYAGVFPGAPVLSDDEATLYCAGKEIYQRSRSVTMRAEIAQYQFFAYNTSDGSVKFRLKTGGNHHYSPALGADNMIYVAGGKYPTGAITSGSYNWAPGMNTPGMVIAIEDKGQQDFETYPEGAEDYYIKWKMVLPDDGVSDTNCCATITVNDKNIIYVASGNGRVYCIEDEGSYGKILWEYFAPELSARNMSGWWTNLTLVPPNLAVADDGSVVVVLGDTLLKFPAGFNPSSPEGISGIVKDAGGNPIADAWVSASPYDQPLADNPNRLWTKTNADGTYNIVPRFTSSTTFPVTYNVAACAVGYGASANQTATFTAADSKIALSDFALASAKHNWAKYSLATAGSENSSYRARQAVDGSMDTRFWSTAAADTLTVDIGAAKKIGEVVINWWWSAGASFTVDYSNDGTNFTTAYTTTVTDNRGFPIDWYGQDPTHSYPNYTTDNVVAGGQKTAVDVIKVPEAVPAAQYWRVTVNSSRYGVVGTHTTALTTKPGWGTNPAVAAKPSIWELELRDATLDPMPAYTSIGDAKGGEPGIGVELSNVKVTAVGSTGGGIASYSRCLESDDRSSGIRAYLYGVSSAINVADRVDTLGKVVTDSNGEKYLNAVVMNRVGTTQCATEPNFEPLMMNNKSACDEISQGQFIKTWGVVSAGDTDYFYVNDGSVDASAPLKVKCGTLTQPTPGEFVTLRGIMGKDANVPALCIRAEQCDWVYDDDFMAKAFTGRYKYPLQYLVLGPFTDSGLADYELIYNAFITEDASALSPKAGDILAGKEWKVGTSVDGILDINAMYGSTEANHAVFYVFLYVWSKDAIGASTLAMPTGSDDWLRAWVGSTEVVTIDDTIYPSGRTTVLGQDVPNEITLNAGLNKILFKVINTTEDSCGLGCQFVPIAQSVAGKTGYGKMTPYAGLGYSLNPDL